MSGRIILKWDQIVERMGNSQPISSNGILLLSEPNVVC